MRSSLKVLAFLASGLVANCGSQDLGSPISEESETELLEQSCGGLGPYWCTWDGSNGTKCHIGGSYVGKYIHVKGRGDCPNLRNSWSDLTAPSGTLKNGTRIYIHRQNHGNTVRVHGITTDWWYLTNNGWITAAYTTDTNGL